MSGLLQPLVRELTDQGDPLSCLAALSMLKEQLEGTNSAQLQSQLAAFFLPHLEQLLQHADAIVKPLAMQVRCLLHLASCAWVTQRSSVDQSCCMARHVASILAYRSSTVQQHFMLSAVSVSCQKCIEPACIKAGSPTATVSVSPKAYLCTCTQLGAV